MVFKKRSELEIYFEILRCCSGTEKTTARLCGLIGSSWVLLSPKLKKLVALKMLSKSLLAPQYKGSYGIAYKTTDLGRDVLKKYIGLLKVMQEINETSAASIVIPSYEELIA